MYQGVFLNLDKSTDRKSYLNKHLEQIGLQEYFTRYQAFDADSPLLHSHPSTNITDTEKACYSTHTQAMQDYCNHNKHLHIVEDDVEMHSDTGKILHHLFCENNFNDFDIIFTGVSFWNTSRQILETNILNTKEDYTLFSLNRDLFFSGLYSYIIHKDKIEKIATLCKEHQFQFSIDLLIRNLIISNQLKAYCILPTIAMPSFLFPSTIDSTQTNRYHLEGIAGHSFNNDYAKLLHRLFFRGESFRSIYGDFIAFFERNNAVMPKISNQATIHNLFLIMSKNHLLNRKGASEILSLYPAPIKVIKIT